MHLSKYCPSNHHIVRFSRKHLQLFWFVEDCLRVLNFFQASLRNCINWVHCDDHFFIFNFISAVRIWFISYTINTQFFHGKIWTHNWPAPNVSAFKAQLVEHRTGIARSRVQTPLKSWIFSGFFTQLHKLRSLRRSFLHFHFIFAVHIWFISYTVNT